MTFWMFLRGVEILIFSGNTFFVKHHLNIQGGRVLNHVFKSLDGCELISHFPKIIFRGLASGCPASCLWIFSVTIDQ